MHLTNYSNHFVVQWRMQKQEKMGFGGISNKTCTALSAIRLMFYSHNYKYINVVGGGTRVVVSTAAFHARVRGSVPGLGGLKETKLFLPHPRVKVSIVGSLRDREVACSA